MGTRISYCTTSEFDEKAYKELYDYFNERGLIEGRDYANCKFLIHDKNYFYKIVVGFRTMRSTKESTKEKRGKLELCIEYVGEMPLGVTTIIKKFKFRKDRATRNF